MRHLFNRVINQWVFQETHCEALLAYVRKYTETLQKKVELNGLLYVIERLPIGLKNVDLLTLLDEGYSKSHFQAIIP
jgi:hypothetical protein